MTASRFGRRSFFSDVGAIKESPYQVVTSKSFLRHCRADGIASADQARSLPWAAQKDQLPTTMSLTRPYGLAIITGKPTMNEITDCRGWRPRHADRRQAAVRYSKKTAHRGPIFPRGRRGRRPLRRRSFITMTPYRTELHWSAPAVIHAGRRGQCHTPYRKSQKHTK